MSLGCLNVEKVTLLLVQNGWYIFGARSCPKDTDLRNGNPVNDTTRTPQCNLHFVERNLKVAKVLNLQYLLGEIIKFVTMKKGRLKSPIETENRVLICP